jgi:hypothetical protein
MSRMQQKKYPTNFLINMFMTLFFTKTHIFYTTIFFEQNETGALNKGK